MSYDAMEGDSLSDYARRLRSLLRQSVDGELTEKASEYKEAWEETKACPHRPKWLVEVPDAEELWRYFRDSIPDSYSARRDHIEETIDPWIEHLESGECERSLPGLEEKIRARGPEGVYDDFRSAHSRLPNDPEGALTAARSMVETACKAAILRTEGQSLTEEQVENLGMNDLVEEAFEGKKERLDGLDPEVIDNLEEGLNSIIWSVSSARQEHGDAHGGEPFGRQEVDPSVAALSLNVAGAASVFLLRETAE